MKKIAIFFTLFVFFMFFVHAEEIYRQSSVIWGNSSDDNDYSFAGGGAAVNSRIDSQGYPSVSLYAFEDGFFKSGPIVARGQILNLSIFYEYEGEVSMALSADNGRTWTDVHNGVILTGGFGAGNIIRWKARISPGSILKHAVVDYTDDRGTITGFGQPVLSGTVYRKRIFLSSLDEKICHNQQVLIELPVNDIEYSVDSLCFTLADGTSIIPHYIEKNDGSNVSIWLRMPEIDGTVQIYMNYVPDIKENLSSAAAVFDYFCDFRDKEKVQEEWSWFTQQNGVRFSSDGMQIRGNTVTSSTTVIQAGKILEWRAASSSVSGIRLSLLPLDSEYGKIETFSSGAKDLEHCIAVDGAVVANSPVPVLKEEEFEFRLLFDEKLSFIKSRGSGETAQVDYLLPSDFVFRKRYKIELKSSFDADNVYKWLRVRGKDVSVRFELDPEYEKIQMPVFVNAVLDLSGDIVPFDVKAPAEYKDTVRRLFFEPAVIIPQLTAIGSVTGINNMSGEYVPGQRYYSSKGGFTSSDNVTFECILNGRSAVSSLGMEYMPGRLTLISPDSGEKYFCGSDIKILWTALEYGNEHEFVIEYSIYGADDYKTAAASAVNTGEYIWQTEGVPPGNYSLRILDKYSGSVLDVSDSTFELLLPEREAESGLLSYDHDGMIEITSPVEAGKIVIGDGKGEKCTVVKYIPSLIRADVVVRKGGQLILAGRGRVEIAGDLDIRAGGQLIAYDINAENISMDRSAELSAAGEVLRIRTSGEFAFFGRITADGVRGADGGFIEIDTGHIITDNEALISAKGADASAADERGGAGGHIRMSVEGEIRSRFDISGGNGRYKGESGSVITENKAV